MKLNYLPNVLRGLFLTMTLLCCSTSAISGTDYYCDFSVGGIFYQFISGKPGEVAVSYDNYETGRYGGNYTNYSGSIVVPSTVVYNSITYKVTAVTDHAFYERSSVTSVTLPSTITSIGACAFTDCTSLTGITLPSALKSIGNSAFQGCIGFTSVYIPDGVESIGTSAFADCQNLSSINIPISVKSVGVGAFNATAWYNNQPDGLVYVGSVAYAYKGTMPENTAIVLRDGTCSITASAFSAKGLTSVSIPESVTSIGASAFRYCTGLTSVSIPESVTYIGDWAFSGCI